VRRSDDIFGTHNLEHKLFPISDVPSNKGHMDIGAIGDLAHGNPVNALLREE